MFWKVVAPLLALGLAVVSAGLVGGPIEADLNEPGLQDALQFAVSQHNKASNDMYINQVSRIIKVEKQVVSGMKYIFTVEMARTGCRKGGAEDVCAVPPMAPTQQCKFSVWSQPWLNNIKLVENQCELNTNQ